MKIRHFATAVIGIYISLIFYYRNYFFQDIDLIVASGFKPILFVVVLIIITHLIRSLKFALIARYANPNQTVTRFISIYCYTMSVCILPGKITELWRIRELAKVQNFGYAKSIITNLADKFTDLLGLLVYGSIAFWTVARSIEFTLFSDEIISSNTTTISVVIFLLVATGFLTKYFMKNQMKKYFSYASELSYLLRPTILAKLFVIGVFAWFPEIISFYILIGLVNGEWGQSTSIFSSYALANVVGGFVPLPAGAVGFEGSLFLLLTLAQVTTGTFTIILCHRVTAVLTTLIMGLCFLAQKHLKNEWSE